MSKVKTTYTEIICDICKDIINFDSPHMLVKTRVFSTINMNYLPIISYHMCQKHEGELIFSTKEKTNKP